MEQKTPKLHVEVRFHLYNQLVAASYLLTVCAIYDTIEQVQKNVLLHPLALKELNIFPRQIQLKFKALFNVLAEMGRLEQPFAKKLAGQDGLFEIRIKHGGQWRVIYLERKHN